MLGYPVASVPSHEDRHLPSQKGDSRCFLMQCLVEKPPGKCRWEDGELCWTGGQQVASGHAPWWGWLASPPPSVCSGVGWGGDVRSVVMVASGWAFPVSVPMQPVLSQTWVTGLDPFPSQEKPNPSGNLLIDPVSFVAGCRLRLWSTSVMIQRTEPPLGLASLFLLPSGNCWAQLSKLT